VTKTNSTKFLMIQGTGSHVGKSVITAALCRIFANKGLRVAPFKAQNMALNSFVTADGCEVGRSTALQATAARSDLVVEMNPILLKPKAEKEAQLILKGKPYADISAFAQFHQNKPLREIKWRAICESLESLKKDFDLIVIEGAGSPAEVNLRAFDLVNMSVAQQCAAPVLLVTDIDRGGSLASLVGTLELLSEDERSHVKGFIFNKFRGDQRLFDPAISFLENKTGRPTIGVIPFNPDLDLTEEDALKSPIRANGEAEIDIAIVHHPTLSNFTDFDPLLLETNVGLRFVRNASQLGRPDLIILPGSKNTGKDLRYLYTSGLATQIKTLAKEDIPVIGICGGYQMMGKALIDPNYIESEVGDMEGLGLLDVVTEFHAGKITAHSILFSCGTLPFFTQNNERIEGYKIHSGLTRPIGESGKRLFLNQAETDEHVDGVISPNGLIFGTSLHGLFENDNFRRRLIDHLRKRRGLGQISAPILKYKQVEDEQIENWSSFVSEHLNIEAIESIIDFS